MLLVHHGSTWCLSVCLVSLSSPSLPLSLNFALCNLVTTEALDQNILVSLVKNKQKHWDKKNSSTSPSCFFPIHPLPFCILLLGKVIMMTGWLVPLKGSFQQLSWTLRALAPAEESFFLLLCYLFQQCVRFSIRSIGYIDKCRVCFYFCLYFLSCALKT